MESSIEISKQDAIDSFDGDVGALANALGITRSAVYLWRDDAPIPERQALRLRYELRPNVFGRRGKRKSRVA